MISGAALAAAGMRALFLGLFRGPEKGSPGEMNANGVPSLSPGLERSDYPGFAVRDFHNPEGVVSQRTTPHTATQPLQGCRSFLFLTQGSSRTRNPGLRDGTPLAFPRKSVMRPFLGLVLCAFVLIALLPLHAPAASLCFNEVVALNDNGRVDEDGDRPDWLELFNGSGASVNLAGYGLSDEDDTPFKWVFPSRTLPVGGLALVFASGKNRTNTANLHANFNIRAEGERLFL